MSTSVSQHRMSRAVLAYAAAFAAFEGYDQLTYGVTVPSLLEDEGMNAGIGAAGAVGALVGFGMIVGAALSAAFMRRFGARNIMLGGTGLFSAAMVVCAVAPTFLVFGGGRALVGIGLGLVTPSVTTYVADLSSPARRSSSIGIMLSGYAVGGFLAPVFGALLLSTVSWRWMYVIGAVPALVLIPLAIRALPHSPVSPADPQARSASELFGLRPLLSSGARATTLLLWVIATLGLLLGFGLSTWLPTIMQTAGYSLGSSLLYTSVMWLAAGLGMVVGGRIADRVGIVRVLSVGFALGAVSLALLSVAPPVGLLFLLLFVGGIGILGSQALVYALIVSRYPADCRGWGLSWAIAVGRAGAIAGPLFGAAVLSSQLGVDWNFYAFALPAVLAAVLTALVPAAHSRMSHREAGQEFEGPPAELDAEVVGLSTRRGERG